MAVDRVLILECSRLALGISVISEGGAALGDGGLKDLGDGVGETGGLGLGDGVSAPQGGELGLEQGFVDVDVAQAGDEVLVEQGGFEPPPGFAESGVERLRLEGRGIGAQGGDVTCEELGQIGVDVEVAEASRVDALDAGMGQAEDEVGVGLGGPGVCAGGARRRVGVGEDLSGHAQVDRQCGALVGGGEDELFSVAEDLVERLADQTVGIPLAVVGAQGVHSKNGLGRDEGREGAADGFDFGKLGHGRSVI